MKGGGGPEAFEVVERSPQEEVYCPGRVQKDGGDLEWDYLDEVDTIGWAVPTKSPYYSPGISVSLSILNLN